MRIKTRPDLHHAPLPDGVYVSAGSEEFALSGWSGFADLMSRCLPLLGQGADEDELVAEIGTEQARPAVCALLAQLDAHGMVLHLDQLATAQPSTEERERHAELLAYLECRAGEPYAAFAEILSTRVLLVGPDAALDVAERALGELGMGGDRDSEPDRLYDAAVVAMPRERVDQIPPRTTRFVPVVIGGSGALVGPLVHDLTDWDTWRALAARVLDRDGSDLQEPPTTAVAVSAAVHLLLQDMAGVAGPAAYVVSGETYAVDALDLPATSPRLPVEVSLAEADDRADDSQVGPGTKPTSPATWLATAIHPWLGVATSHAEDVLPQMPLALRRVRLLDGTVALGAAADQQGASVDLLLQLARCTSGGSAGTTPVRWLLDGALHELAAYAGPARSVTIDHPESRRLARALGTGDDPTVTVHTVPGIPWSLARIPLAHGRTASAWAPTPEQATVAALRRAVVATHVPTEAATVLAATGHTLADATDEDVAALTRAVQTWAAARDLRLVGRPAPVDPMTGRGPIHAGRVRFAAHGSTTGPAPDPVAGLTAYLGEQTGAQVVATRGWDPVTVRAAMDAAQVHGGTMLPVQLALDHVSIGPLWGSDLAVGCPACAEQRRRTVLDHVLAADLESTPLPAGAPSASLVVLATEELAATAPVVPGEVLHVSTDGVSRHRIVPLPGCTWCAPDPGDQPVTLALVDQALDADDPTRVADGTPLLRQVDLEAQVVDARYGPVRGVLREENMPFAMSMAVLAGSPVMGHGRGLTFAQTRSVSVLEAYERLAGFPYEAPLVHGRSYSDVAAQAVDPLTLGQYTPEQLAHPTSKVLTYHPDLPIDWTWGTDLATGTARLVPAEVGFYQYDYHFRRDQRSSRAAGARERRRIFLESSSGCALGSSLAEATVHALFEVAERDAFQLAWHRAQPLPSIAAGTLDDPVVDELIELVNARGYDVHLLVATSDIDIPVVWVLAVSQTGAFPATFTSAGSGADPVGAVRSGLREVAQLVTMPLDWSHQDALELVADPWNVRELEDHVRWSSAPEVLPRVTAVLGGPQVSVAEAFPGWPEALQPDEPGSGILGVLDNLRGRFGAAGLDEIVVVDQSTREHHDLGIHVAKTVVPGTVPMVFGHAHQRLAGLPRLDAALAGLPDRAGRPLDPHPFP